MVGTTAPMRTAMSPRTRQLHFSVIYPKIKGVEWETHRGDANLLVTPVELNASVTRRAAVLSSPVGGHCSSAVDPKGPVTLPLLLTPFLALLT